MAVSKTGEALRTPRAIGTAISSATLPLFSSSMSLPSQKFSSRSSDLILAQCAQGRSSFTSNKNRLILRKICFCVLFSGRKLVVFRVALRHDTRSAVGEFIAQFIKPSRSFLMHLSIMCSDRVAHCAPRHPPSSNIAATTKFLERSAIQASPAESYPIKIVAILHGKRH